LAPEIINQILSYLLPDGPQSSFDFECDVVVQHWSDFLSNFWTLIQTNSVLAHSATYLVYSTSEFWFRVWGLLGVECFRDFIHIIGTDNLSLIRRLHISTDVVTVDEAEELFRILLDAQDRGMKLTKFGLFVHGNPTVARGFLPGGVLRNAVLQLKGLKTFDFCCSYLEESGETYDDEPITNEEKKDFTNLMDTVAALGRMEGISAKKVESGDDVKTDSIDKS
jgi:hypothetical protein